MVQQNGDVILKLGSAELPGAIIVNVVALISTLALILVVLRVAWQAIKFRWKGDGVLRLARDSFFFRTRMGAYAACILIGNLFSSIAGVIGIWWVAERQIVPGSMCTAQAIFMSMGNFAGAYFTVALGVHTFNSLVLRYRQSLWLGVLVIASGWVLALVLALVLLSPATAAKSSAMYGPGEVTCGVQSSHARVLFYHHLFPIFSAALLSAILYSLIFLALRGSLNFRGGIRIDLNPAARWTGRMGTLEDYHRFVLAIGRNMLWYPVAFIVLLLPYSFIRTLMLSGNRVPPSAVMFAFACWYLLGMVNVIILYNTFRLLSPAMGLRSSVSIGTAKSNDSHQSGEDVEKQDNLSLMTQNSLPRVPPVLILSAQQRSPTKVKHRSASPPDYNSAASEGDLSDRIYRPRIISSVSKLNEIITVPIPSATVLHSRTDHARLSSLDNFGLPFAPRSTRSPVVRHPTIENVQAMSAAAAAMLSETGTHSQNGQMQASEVRPTFEHEIFGISSSEALASERAPPNNEADFGVDSWVHPPPRYETPTPTIPQATAIRPLPPTPPIVAVFGSCYASGNDEEASRLHGSTASTKHYF